MTDTDDNNERVGIETLLAERARVEAWLDQVAAKASTMPAHVVERVRRDYDARLAKVVADLAARADELRGETSAIHERLDLLASELTARRDARAEDELRALVGEFDEAAWRVKAEEHDSGIGKLEAERAEREAEYSRMRDLLAETTRAPRAMAQAQGQAEPFVASTHAVLTGTPDVLSRNVLGETHDASTEEVPAADAEGMQMRKSAARAAESAPANVEAPAEPAAEPPPAAFKPERAPSLGGVTRPSGLFTPPAPAPSQRPTTKRPSPFDEIGFLRTVVGRVTPFPKAEAPPLPSERVPQAPSGEKSPPQRAEPRRSGERPGIPAFEAPPIPDVPATTPARASAPAMPAFTDEPPPSLSDTADGTRASTGTDDAARSLKCQECGWMNYPTEWYCEKCGGELAAF